MTEPSRPRSTWQSHAEDEQKMAEGVGFEPTVELPLHGISSAAPSATRPPLPISLMCFKPNLGLHSPADTISRQGCPTLGRWSPAKAPRGTKVKLAEGRGFEPPRDLRPYPISSRTPSTGLGHPSAPLMIFSFERTHSVSHRIPGQAPPRSQPRGD